MKPNRSLLVATATVALLALLAGCGGGSSSSSSSETASTPSRTKPPAETEPSGEVTRAAYIKEADAVCKANDEVSVTLNRELAELEKSGRSESPDGEAELGELLVRLVFLGQEEGKELAQIQPPIADIPTITRWIGTGHEGLDTLEAGVGALEKGNTTGFEDAYGLGLADLKKAQGIAKGYGFKVCGSGPEVQTIR